MPQGHDSGSLLISFRQEQFRRPACLTRIRHMAQKVPCGCVSPHCVVTLTCGHCLVETMEHDRSQKVVVLSRYEQDEWRRSSHRDFDRQPEEEEWSRHRRRDWEREEDQDRGRDRSRDRDRSSHHDSWHDCSEGYDRHSR